MTTINPADIKVGDRIRYSREGVVLAVLPNNKRVRLEVPYANGNGSTVFNLETDLVTTEFELLERALPEEPVEGSIVIFHPPNERHLTQTTVYQHFADHWQSTRVGGQDRYTWAEVLKLHDGEHLEVLVTTP